MDEEPYDDSEYDEDRDEDEDEDAYDDSEYDDSDSESTYYDDDTSEDGDGAYESSSVDHRGIQVNVGGTMYQSMPPMPNGRFQMQVNCSGTNNRMASQVMPTGNVNMQYTQVPHLNALNQNRNGNGNGVATSGSRRMPSRDYVSDETLEAIDLLTLDDAYDRPRPATGRYSRAQNAPQSVQQGQANYSPPTSSSVGAGTGQSASMECAICLDDMNSQNISTTPCGHLFCTACITQAIRIDRCCPLCKKPVALDKLLRIYLPSRN